MEPKPGYGNRSWEIAWRRWRRLAEKGYGERCNTLSEMNRVDERIRKAKERYEFLLKKFKEN